MPTFPRNFVPVPPGRLLPFLQSVADSGRRTVLYQGCAAAVMRQTRCLRLIHTVRGDSFWLLVKTTKNAERRRWDRFDRVHGEDALQSQPCWTGEPFPSGYARVPVEKTQPGLLDWATLRDLNGFFGFRIGAGFPARTLKIERAPRRRRPRAEPTLISETGFKVQDVVAAIRKRGWSDADNAAVYARLILGWKSSAAAAEYGISIRTLYNHVSVIKKGLPKPRSCDFSDEGDFDPIDAKILASFLKA